MVTSTPESNYGRLRRPQTHLLNNNSNFRGADHLGFIEVYLEIKGLTPPCFTAIFYQYIYLLYVTPSWTTNIFSCHLRTTEKVTS